MLRDSLISLLSFGIKRGVSYIAAETAEDLLRLSARGRWVVVFDPTCMPIGLRASVGLLILEENPDP